MARVPSGHAVIAGDQVHVAGIVGTMGETSSGRGRYQPQTTQTIRNIGRILQAVGPGLDDVVKLNVYLADMSHFVEVNAAYIMAIGDCPPARITIGGVDLAPGAAVEMDRVAYGGRPDAGGSMPHPAEGVARR